MPSFRHHDATIHYEEFGRGFPILTFAPAGLQSTIEVWSKPMAPIDPTREWADTFRVIDMDQRNAGGQSRAPITAKDGWDTYTGDHPALLVLAQPIGRVGPMPAGRTARFDAWAETVKDHPEATPAVLDALFQNLYGPGFVYCVDRAFVSTVRTPCLVLAGNDEAHSWAISDELSARVRVKEFLAKHTSRA